MASVWFCALLALYGCEGCKSKGGRDGGALGVVDERWLFAEPPWDESTPRSGGTLVVRVDEEPKGLNALDDAHQSVWMTRITRNLVYESLLELDSKTFKMKPLLAESVTIGEDFRTFTFRLKEGRHFADGSPVRAEDVLASIDATMSPKSRSTVWRKRLEGLDLWTKTADGDVQVSFKAPRAFMLQDVGALPIYSRATLEGDFATMEAPPTGSGPFVPVEWIAGERLVLERSPHSSTGARLDRLVFRFVPDAKQARELAEQGAFDLWAGVTSDDWRDLEKPEARNLWAQKNYWRLMSVENNFSYLAWNHDLPFFQGAGAYQAHKIRNAFAHVFPGRKVFLEIDQRLELPTSCPYYSGGYGCVAGIAPAEFDPVLARALLADAGFVDSDSDGVAELDGTPLKFTFVVPTSPPRMGKIAPMFKEELRKIGAAMDIETVAPEKLQERIRARDFGVVGAEFSSTEPEVEIAPLLHSRGIDAGTNIGAFSHPDFDRLFDKIHDTASAERRHDLEKYMHGGVVEVSPIQLISTRPGLDLAKRRVKGLVPGPLWYDLRAVWLGAAESAAADGGR